VGGRVRLHVPPRQCIGHCVQAARAVLYREVEPEELAEPLMLRDCREPLVQQELQAIVVGADEEVTPPHPLSGPPAVQPAPLRPPLPRRSRLRPPPRSRRTRGRRGAGTDGPACTARRSCSRPCRRRSYCSAGVRRRNVRCCWGGAPAGGGAGRARGAPAAPYAAGVGRGGVGAPARCGGRAPRGAPTADVAAARRSKARARCMAVWRSSG